MTKNFKPIISLSLIIVFVLLYIFFRMEVVRVSYEIGRINHIKSQEIDDRAQLEVTYNKLIRPSRLDRIGTVKLALSRVQKRQVVLMSQNGRIAIKQ